MVDVKTGNRAVNAAQVIRGDVREIDVNNVALVRLSSGQDIRVRADMLRGKSAAPKAGESWLLDQLYGGGWMFAVPIGYLGGDQGFTTPTFTNSWRDAGTPYQPVGYMLDAEGWVNMQGRVTAGGAGTSAFTLPPGYLPAGTALFAVAAGSSTGLVTVTASGTVTPATSITTSLEQVRFLAAG